MQFGVWLTDSGLLSDTWIVGGGIAYTLFSNLMAFTPLVNVCLFLLKKVSLYLCAMLLFLCPSLVILKALSVFLFVPGVTILLSITVFSLLVAQVLPQTSDAVPLIGQIAFHFAAAAACHFPLITFIKKNYFKTMHHSFVLNIEFFQLENIVCTINTLKV